MLHILYTIAQTVLRRTRLRAQETIEARGCLRRVKFLQRVLPGGEEGDRLVRAGPLVSEMLLGADPTLRSLRATRPVILLGRLGNGSPFGRASITVASASRAAGVEHSERRTKSFTV